MTSRAQDFIYSPGYVLNSLGSKVFKGRPSCRAYLVDLEGVSKAKKEASCSVPFVSTNDVLTACFASFTKARVGGLKMGFEIGGKGVFGRHFRPFGCPKPTIEVFRGLNEALSELFPSVSSGF